MLPRKQTGSGFSTDVHSTENPKGNYMSTGFTSANITTLLTFAHGICTVHVRTAKTLMYTVANSIVTDHKMYRYILEVSFYFRGPLYEMNVFLTLFLQIEVSI